jgi:hypothetical protein
VLQPIPEEIEPVITEEQWALRPRRLDLKARDRNSFDRMITYYRLNQGETVPSQPPRKTRKMLRQAAKNARVWARALSSLNSVGELLDARAQIAVGNGVAERKNNARAEVTALQASLDKLAAHLEQGAQTDQLPRGVRTTKQQSEVLYHLIYVLHVYLRFGTGKGLSRGKSPDYQARRDLAVWLFKIASNGTLPTTTILTAAEKAIRNDMQSGEYLDIVHWTIPSVCGFYVVRLSSD